MRPTSAHSTWVWPPSQRRVSLRTPCSTWSSNDCEDEPCRVWPTASSYSPASVWRSHSIWRTRRRHVIWPRSVRQPAVLRFRWVRKRRKHRHCTWNDWTRSTTNTILIFVTSVRPPSKRCNRRTKATGDSGWAWFSSTRSAPVTTPSTCSRSNRSRPSSVSWASAPVRSPLDSHPFSRLSPRNW